MKKGNRKIKNFYILIVFLLITIALLIVLSLLLSDRISSNTKIFITISRQKEQIKKFVIKMESNDKLKNIGIKKVRVIISIT